MQSIELNYWKSLSKKNAKDNNLTMNWHKKERETHTHFDLFLWMFLIYRKYIIICRIWNRLGLNLILISHMIVCTLKKKTYSFLKIKDFLNPQTWIFFTLWQNKIHLKYFKKVYNSNFSHSGQYLLQPAARRMDAGADNDLLFYGRVGMLNLHSCTILHRQWEPS